MSQCFGPAIGHHQYWKASPVDTTPLVFREHKESGLKLGLWGGHTLSREERKCLAGPKLQEVTETFCLAHANRTQLNSQEDPVTQGRVAGIVYKGASLDC